MVDDGSARYCSSCSESTSLFKPRLQVIRHRHEDSAAWRASISNSSHKYPCHTCKVSYHSFDITCFNKFWTGGRIPVLATASTLFQWQGARHRTGYEGDPLHVERVSVAGATVQILGHAIANNYFKLGIPIDLLVCCGLNNISQGRSAFEIMSDYVMLQEAVQWNLPTSTLILCTLPLPPRLCRFPGDIAHGGRPTLRTNWMSSSS